MSKRKGCTRFIMTVTSDDTMDCDIEFFIKNRRAQIREYWPDGEVRTTPMLSLDEVTKFLLSAFEAKGD